MHEDAVEELLSPPHRASAVRSDAHIWSVVAESLLVVEVRGLDEAATIDLTVVERRPRADGRRRADDASDPALDAVAAEYGDVALSAERIDGDLVAIDVLRL